MKNTTTAPSGAKTIRPLSEAEAAALAHCERLIEHDADTEAEAGEALRRIRDGQLHRATHGSFDAYCRERWNDSPSRVGRMIDASLAAEKLSPPEPVNEAQTHQLALLPPDEVSPAPRDEEQGHAVAASRNQLQLHADEALALQQHEALIARGIATFIEEVGASLRHIRDERLYRATHGTFEEYCRERWGLGRRYVNYQIQAADVVANLGTIVPKPTHETQLRPLATLAPEDQRTAWTRAVEESDGKPPTALKVSEMVHERIVERQREAGIVEPPPAKRPDSNPPLKSRRELKESRQRERNNRIRDSHVWDLMDAIEKLAKPALPLDEVATEIPKMNWSDADWVGQSEEALSNLQILVRELHKVNPIPASTSDGER